MPLDDGGNDRILVLIIMVDVADTHLCRACNTRHAGIVKTEAHKAVGGSVKDLGASDFLASFLRR